MTSSLEEKGQEHLILKLEGRRGEAGKHLSKDCLILVSQSNTPQMPLLYLIHLMPGMISSIKITLSFINVQPSVYCAQFFHATLLHFVEKIKERTEQIYLNYQGPTNQV